MNPWNKKSLNWIIIRGEIKERNIERKIDHEERENIEKS